MAWDSSRPVPWQRLMREWVIYAGIMGVVLLVFFRDGGVVGALAGVFVSGPLYLAFGFVMAKFGYQRKTLKDMRTPQKESSNTAGAGDASNSTAPRGRPAPTSRTSTGRNQPKAKKRR